MSVEFVRVTADEVDKWRHVVSWVYSRQAAEPDAYGSGEGESRFLVTVDGVPASACSVIDFTVVRGIDNLRCGGVAGVATLPEWRRTGAANHLMTEVLLGMEDDGFSISALYAYRDPYYRKFGYASCGWRWQIKCPQDRLPKFELDLVARQIQNSELECLNEVYLPFIRSRSGSVLRTKEDWEHRMGKKAPMVYAIGDPMEAYLWVNLEDFWGEAVVGEIAWVSQRGYENALALVRSLCSNQSAAVWNEPQDSPYLSQYYDQGPSLTMSRPTMFRIVSVERALQAVSADSEGSFCVEVTDQGAPWNACTWTVEFGPGGTSVRRGGTAGIHMDVSALSQVVMGQPSIGELRSFGIVCVTDEAHFHAASQLLNPRSVVCMDFF